MVVVVGSDPPFAVGSPPPIYATLRRFNGHLCTLACREYNWWQLGETEIVAMPVAHRDQEHKFFPNFAEAAQHVHRLMFGTTTDFMRTFEVCLRGPACNLFELREMLQTTSHGLNIELHATTRVRCVITPAAADRWFAVHETLPLIPPALRLAEAMAQAPHHVLKTASSRSPAPVAKRSADASSPLAPSEAKRRKIVRIQTRDGIVVWDRNPELIPPVAWVVRGHSREAKPRPGCGNSTLLLELERIPIGPPGERRRSAIERVIGGPPPERAQRHITEMAEFTELLPEIWDQRIPQLPAAQREEATSAVCTALVQRLKIATQLSPKRMWEQAMRGTACPSACPVLDE
jgi:hypothetical protein